MKKYFVLLLISSQLYSQEKSKIIYSEEIVTINSSDILEISTLNSEKRAIAKSKNTSEYAVRIPYNSFCEVSNINGSTYNPNTNKTSYLSPTSIGTYDDVNESIYKSDNKYKYFSLPKVEDNSTIEYSYKIKYKQPRLLSAYFFQNNLKTESSKFQIKCKSTTEIGYALFGQHQDKIVFSKTKDGNFDVYTWEAEDIPEFEPEVGIPSSLHFLPHIIYYVKSYENNGKKEELLGTPLQLYKWYHSLVKNINQKSQSEIEAKTAELIKDKTNDFDKAKSIYHWVQQNMHYVAFEDGMGGFVPREAADVFQKLYGDCKDMANLLNQMLRYAKLNSNLTWIGTRLKPYKYVDVPTPLVDNHMITHLVIDGKSYFLDATDKFCPFPLPSTMIQGKEALIAKSENEFTLEDVPEIPQNQNKIAINLNLNIQNNSIDGEANATISGINKSYLLNNLSVNTQDGNEIWKSLITSKNQKIQLEILETQQNDYKDISSNAKFKLKLEDGVKTVNNKFLLKPLLLSPLKEALIDIEKRKLSIEKEIKYSYEFKYEYKLPVDLKVEFLPENAKIENDLASFDIQYKVSNNTISVSQKIESKTLLIENKDFPIWNTFIKSLNKQYNQSIILSK